MLKNFIIKGTQKNSLIGQFTFDVEPDVSIYGIQRMIKAELGGSAICVRILRRNRKFEVLDHMKTLEDYGYKGSALVDRPEVVELFYDYDYPKLDCPLLLANISRWFQIVGPPVVIRTFSLRMLGREYSIQKRRMPSCAKFVLKALGWNRI